MQYLNDGVFITDSENKILFMNRAIEKITGYTEEELLGKTPAILKSGIHSDNFYKKMWNSLINVGCWEGEVFNRKKNEELYYEWLKIIVIKDDLGQIKNFIAILSDITKEKELEKEMLLTGLIQQRLLPKQITNEFFKVKTYYEPKKFVSGDFYDYVWVEETKKLNGILIDFKGHGLSAALLTSAMQVLFRKVIQDEIPLEEKVNRLNELSVYYFTEDTFAAVFCFELDFEAGTLSYVSAGISHFLSIGEKSKKIVEVPGLFLGVFEDEKYEKKVIKINEGDIFYFMTDGASEVICKEVTWHGNGIEDTYEQLIETVNSKQTTDDKTIFGLEIIKTREKNKQLSETFIFNEVEEFHSVSEQVGTILNPLGIANKDLLFIALVEAVNNAWLHGNKRDKFKDIIFTIKVIRGRRVIFRIKDQGQGFNGNERIQKYTGKIEEEFEKRIFDESGRGLLIMMKVFDKVLYNQSGNEMLLVKNSEK